MSPPLPGAPGWVVGRTVGLASAAVGAGTRRLRRATEAVVAAWLAALVPRVVEAVLDRLDLTALVRERVDLDALVATVDLDRVAARLELDEIVARVDLDRVVARVDLDRIVDRLDLDALVARVDVGRVVDRVDVTRVLDRLDLTALVRDRVDLDALVARVDLDRIVDRVDVGRVLDRVDVDGVVDRVDLARVVARLDLAGIVNDVMDEVDLPDVIRESTGSMASETVRAVRLQGIGADARVAALVARVLPLLGRQRSAAYAVDRGPGGEGPDAESPGSEAAAGVPLPRADSEATARDAAVRPDDARPGTGPAPRDEPGRT